MGTRASRYEHFTVQTLPAAERIPSDWRDLTSARDVARLFPQRMDDLLGALDLERGELAAVQQAVEAGDRAGACEALVAHFRSRELPAAVVELLGLGELSEEARADADRIDRLRRLSERAMHDIFPRTGVAEKMPRLSHGGLDWRYVKGLASRQWSLQVSRHQEFVWLLKTWRRTGEERYAAHFDRMIRDWCAHETAITRHGIHDNMVWGNLNLGIRLRGPWPRAFFGFQQAEAFRPASRLLMLASFLDHQRSLERFTTAGNWLTMELAGMMTTASLFLEFRDAARWRSAVAERVAEEIDRQFYPDGAQYELSSGYHWVAPHNLEDGLSAARAMGFAVPPSLIARFQPLYQYMVDIISPLGTNPQNNDTDWNDQRRRIRQGLETFDRPTWRYVVTGGEAGERPADPPSRYAPYAGQLISRSGWGTDDQWSFFDVGPWGKAHQHNDKLHLSVVAGGRQLLVDSGRFNYDGPIAQRFRKPMGAHSRGHNVLLVEGLTQVNAPRRAVGPHPWAGMRAGFDFAMADWTHGYAEKGWEHDRVATPFVGTKPDRFVDVRHRRAVVYLRDRGWLVIDRVLPDRERLISALWHFHPDCAVTLSPEGDVLTADEGETNLRIQPLGEVPWAVRFVRGQDEPHTQGWYSVRAGTFEPATCVLYEEPIDEPTVFAWMLTTAAGEPPRFEVDRRPARDGAVRYALTFADGETVEVAVALDAGGPVALDEGTTLRGLCAVRDAGGVDVACGSVTDATGTAIARDALIDAAAGLRTWLQGLPFRDAKRIAQYSRTGRRGNVITAGVQTRGDTLAHPVAPAGGPITLSVVQEPGGASAEDEVDREEEPTTPVDTPMTVSPDATPVPMEIGHDPVEGGATSWKTGPRATLSEGTTASLFPVPTAFAVPVENVLEPRSLRHLRLVATRGDANAVAELMGVRHFLDLERSAEPPGAMGEDALLDAWAQRLAGATVLRATRDATALGEVRLLAGATTLALRIDVFDTRFGADRAAWPGAASVELYASLPGDANVGQVIVHPNRTDPGERLSFYRLGQRIDGEAFPHRVAAIDGGGYRIIAAVPYDRLALPPGADTFEFEVALYAQATGWDAPRFVTLFHAWQPFRWDEHHAVITVGEVAPDPR